MGVEIEIKELRNALGKHLNLMQNVIVNLPKLIQSKRKEILEIAAGHGATNLRLFGSVATGKSAAGSDIDILINLEKNRSLLDQIGLKQDLEELLGHEVDVVTEKSLHWYIRDRVLKEATPL